MHSYLLINSTYGRAFKAIRDDEIAAEAMGINLFHHKQMAFVISSFFAGVGGALLAMYQGSLQANAFKSSMTYEILLIVVIGGMGSISGSVLARSCSLRAANGGFVSWTTKRSSAISKFRCWERLPHGSLLRRHHDRGVVLPPRPDGRP